jgi:hypothetical protein
MVFIQRCRRSKVNTRRLNLRHVSIIFLFYEHVIETLLCRWSHITLDQYSLIGRSFREMRMIYFTDGAFEHLRCAITPDFFALAIRQKGKKRRKKGECALNEGESGLPTALRLGCNTSNIAFAAFLSGGDYIIS